jgi:hypothetical protein
MREPYFVRGNRAFTGRDTSAGRKVAADAVRSTSPRPVWVSCGLSLEAAVTESLLTLILDNDPTAAEDPSDLDGADPA